MLNSNQSDRDRLLKTAFILAVVTVVYNIVEGVVSTAFGWSDDTLALFGFGLDSFIEVVSGLGIAHMVWRMRRTPVEGWDRFERQALMVTGVSFYVLAAGLAAGGLMNLYEARRPETTVPGLVISAISIATMWWLYRRKMAVGDALGSDPIRSDAACTRTCLQLSVILLVSSGVYLLFRIPYIDALGALGIAFFAWREGRESIEKARSDSLTCSCGGECHGAGADREE